VPANFDGSAITDRLDPIDLNGPSRLQSTCTTQVKSSQVAFNAVCQAHTVTVTLLLDSQAYPSGGFPSEYCYVVWHGKARMAWLPDGENFLMICLFVLT